MEIQILGAHCLESETTRLTSLLVDDILALDAGGLTSGLTFEAQRNLRAVLLTHQHFDHVRDVVLVGYYTYLVIDQGVTDTKSVYATSDTLDNLLTDLLNGRTFPDFTQPLLSGKQPLRFCPLEPCKPENIGEYTVLALPVKHSVPTVGYAITSKEGRTLFYTGDTGPGISDCWEHISPDLLITEMTGTNALTAKLESVGHFSPRLLKQELVEFQKIKAYLPRTILIHLAPELEDQIREEVGQVAVELGADIDLGYEGMTISL